MVKCKLKLSYHIIIIQSPIAFKLSMKCLLIGLLVLIQLVSSFFMVFSIQVFFADYFIQFYFCSLIMSFCILILLIVSFIVSIGLSSLHYTKSIVSFFFQKENIT